MTGKEILVYISSKTTSPRLQPRQVKTALRALTHGPREVGSLLMWMKYSRYFTLFNSRPLNNFRDKLFSPHSLISFKYYYYSRTSRKRPPQIRRLIGRLREVVAYEIRTTGEFFRSEKMSWHIFFKEENLLHAIFKFRYVRFHVVTKVLRIFLVGWCTQRP